MLDTCVNYFQEGIITLKDKHLSNIYDHADHNAIEFKD